MAALMARVRAWPALGALVGWTVVLWLSRLRNVLGNDELSGSGVAWRVAVVVIFGGLAALAWMRPGCAYVIALFVGWTVAFWLVRGGGILFDDHSAGFKAIHTALMAVSIGAAMWVWRTRSR